MPSGKIRTHVWTEKNDESSNGREVLYLEITLSQNSVPIRFAGYYHSGVKSNIQVVAYCIAADFEVYRKDVDEFINGIEIREGSSPGR